MSSAKYSLEVRSTLVDIRQSDLIYIAEGNANIVLKLPDHKKVLRLPKTENEKSINSLNINAEKCQMYMVLIMQLLDPKYVAHPSIIEISPEERDRLNNFLIAFRPEQRLHKNFTGKYGLLLSDATFLDYQSIRDEELQADTYSIEIKPKQGWMFEKSTRKIVDQKGLRKCRYCCMQYLKLNNNKISSRSKYCPMDLFSGNIRRMKKAIEALLEEPQNNFRFFKNGELIYGDNIGDKLVIDCLLDNIGKSVFYNLVLLCLLHENNFFETGTNPAGDYLNFECDSRNILPSSSILKKILDLQLLVKWNLEWMSHKDLNDTKSYTALNSLISKNKKISLRDLSPEERYMIGATFLDVSLMITFKRTNVNNLEGISNNVELKIVGEIPFVTKVSLMDLDPKSDNHFKKFVDQSNQAFTVTKEKGIDFEEY